MTETPKIHVEQGNFTNELISLGSRIDILLAHNTDQNTVNLNPSFETSLLQDGSAVFMGRTETFRGEINFPTYTVWLQKSTADTGIQKTIETARYIWDQRDPGNKSHQRRRIFDRDSNTLRLKKTFS